MSTTTDRYRLFTGWLAAGCLTLTAHCGGQATIDGFGGGGGGSDAGSGGSPQGNGGGGAGGVVSPVQCQPNAGSCAEACDIIFCCAEDECPGLGRTTEASFVAECVRGCQDNPAMVPLVDGNDCGGTISLLSSFSAQFKKSCEG